MATQQIFFHNGIKAEASPILVSIPHAGTEIPEELQSHFNPQLQRELPDTDWGLRELYDFCFELGIPVWTARFSRLVIDLNRPTTGPALYQDQRRQTEALPTTTFMGEALYLPGHEPQAEEKIRRQKLYYDPYYAALEEALQASRRRFPQVLLWDAHSIRRHVASLSEQAFPDLILGDRKGQTAHPRCLELARDWLRQGPYQLSLNEPFQGGQITRHFGRRQQGISSLQLEMSQDLYWDANRGDFAPAGRASLALHLKKVLTELKKNLELGL